MNTRLLNNIGFSIIEILVSLSILITLFLGLSSLIQIVMGSYSDIERRKELIYISHNIVNSLYQSSIEDLLNICKDKGAMDKTSPDPCISSSGQLSNTLPPVPKNPTLSQLFDAKLYPESLTSGAANDGKVLGCVHIVTCHYVMTDFILEFVVDRHWVESTKAVQSKRISVRRGLK